MPTYQYVCSACDEPLEAVQAFTDDALTTCPTCGVDGLRKVYGSVGVVFKGSGFYRNDARTSSPSQPAAATPAASTEAPAGASGATAAPATPAPSTPAPTSGSSPAASSSA